MQRVKPLLATLIGIVILGCSSSPGPESQRSLPIHYEHTFEFMWEEVRMELQKSWYIEQADPAKRVFTTRWEERLSPMGHKGRRHRLLVVVEGEDGAGYEVNASQETELNANDRNPLSSEDADWSGTSSDGALADRFLIGLARRLYPRMEWKRDMIR